MFLSIIYIVSYVAFLLLLFFHKKTDKVLNGITYFVFTFLLTWCYEAVCAGMLNLVKIPVNLLSITIFNAIACIGLGVGYIKKKKERQKYYWKAMDISVCFIMLALVIVIGTLRYSIGFDIFRFKSGDGAIHLIYTEKIVRNGTFSEMYFHRLMCAIFIMICKPFISAVYYYRLYLLFELFILFIGAVSFWLLVRDDLNTKWKEIVGVILTAVYLLGYPLNNMLYGFNYWGSSIILITLILFIMKEYKQNHISFNVLVISLLFVNASLCICYVYFAPVLYGAELLWMWFQNKNKWKKKLLFTIISLGLSGIFCLIYIFWGMFGGRILSNQPQETQEVQEIVSEEVEEESQETKEEKKASGGKTIAGLLGLSGTSYYDVYSNFVFLLPFLFVYFMKAIKEKKSDEYVFITVITILYIGIQFIGLISKIISLYYFNKNYNLLWLLCFAIMIRVIGRISKEEVTMYMAYGLTCACMFIGAILHVDDGLRQWDENICREDRAEAYFDLIVSNVDTLTDRYNELKMNEDQQELCNVAAQLTSQGKSVAYVAEWSRFDDFYAITNQTSDEKWNLETEYTKVEQRIVDYAYVGRYKYEAAFASEYVDTQERIFENEYGYIIKVK